MNYSMDGFRKQLHGELLAIKTLIESAEDGEPSAQDLVEHVNALITQSNGVNCVSCDTDPLFNDLSNLEIEHVALPTDEGVHFL
ncbi:hypothetical protein [Alteromonas macleodii]|uniref:Uncharacterized protein n=1 Tax=Alteromonas macleodii TaxID=28108 RepID=A0AB36FP61_ALTMA|nr:hypothetical protein [Alteromonas macleodii]OES24198.1 hypothetical protein BFV93_4798 [Alteromonas macleodii]OES24830.1 hypothetical protein BFV95_4589 [Alteromonas macleodii]OES25108.1 hypothetical protein BFV94_4579 [Alteromonas macleodii]OES39151.1 hypothetical protein BFV96_4299 [Alteromonas macleodii]